MCEIIPKKILKNIAKNDTRKGVKEHYNTIIDTKDKQYRIKRKQIQDNLRKGIEPDGVDRTHLEHLLIYDNQYSWDYSNNKLWEEFKQNHVNAPALRPKRIFTKNLDSVYDLFHDLLDRESFDNQNATLQTYLKYGSNYPNAFWDGEYLVFGTGDKYYFNDFSKIYDVLGHELGHAITQYESNLVYENQAGALNEHISDVFGIVAYQKKYNLTVEKSDWIIGKGLFTKRVNGIGLRSFKDEVAYDDPVIGKDEQPKYMKDYQDLPNTEDGDWGGVHTNSGIPNHAFYLFNTKLGGKTWENGSFEIWYKANLKTNGLQSNATFRDFAEKTLSFGQKTSELEQAWKEVGVLN